MTLLDRVVFDCSTPGTTAETPYHRRGEIRVVATSTERSSEGIPAERLKDAERLIELLDADGSFAIVDTRDVGG